MASETGYVEPPPYYYEDGDQRDDPPCCSCEVCERGRAEGEDLKEVIASLMFAELPRRLIRISKRATVSAILLAGIDRLMGWGTQP